MDISEKARDVLDYLEEYAKPKLEKLGHTWHVSYDDHIILISTEAPQWESWVTAIEPNGRLSWCGEQNAPEVDWGIAPWIHGPWRMK